MSEGGDKGSLIILTICVGAFVLGFLAYWNLKKSAPKEDVKEAKETGKKGADKKAKPTAKDAKASEQSAPQKASPSDQQLCRVQFAAHSSKCFGACWLATPANSSKDANGGGFIVTIGKDRTMLLHEVASLQERSRRNFRVNLDCGTDVPALVSGSPDGRFVLLGYKSSAAVAYQVHKKKVDGKLTKVLAEYKKTTHGDIISMKVVNQMILTCYEDKSIVLSSYKGEQVNVLQPKLLKLNQTDIDPNGSVIAVASAMSDVRLYHTLPVTGPLGNPAFKKHQNEGTKEPTGPKHGIEANHFAQLKGHKAAVTGVCFTADGLGLASTSHDGTWKLWNLDGDYSRAFEPQVRFSGGNPDANVKYERCVLSPDGQYLLIGCTLGAIQVWRVDGEKSALAHSYAISDKSELTDLSWSPCSRQFCASSHDGMLRVFAIPA